MINSVYLQKIPVEIIINNIIPYTYHKQNDDLLLDIISFRRDLNIINNLYVYDYNYHMLLFDLLSFFNVETIMLRNYSIHNNIITESKVANYSAFFLNKKKLKKVIKFIWGLLTIHDRTRFINNFIE
jgi:hypothetical protein